MAYLCHLDYGIWSPDQHEFNDHVTQFMDHVTPFMAHVTNLWVVWLVLIERIFHIYS